MASQWSGHRQRRQSQTIVADALAYGAQVAAKEGGKDLKRGAVSAKDEAKSVRHACFKPTCHQSVCPLPDTLPMM